MKKIASLILLVFCMLFIEAQEIKKYNLSLKEACELALSNNKNLKNARLSVVLSNHNVKDVISQGLPQVNGSLEYLTYFNYSMEFGFGGGSEMTADQMYQMLSSKGVDLAAMDNGDFETMKAISALNSGSTAIKMKDQSTAKVQLSQLIFSSQYIIGIQTAKLAKEISEKSLSNSMLDTKEMVANAYYLTLVNQEMIKIINKNLENLGKILKQTDVMYKAGILEIYDVDQIRIQVSMLQNSKKSLERNNVLNYNMLRFQLGIEAGAEITLTDNLENILLSTDYNSSLNKKFELEKNTTFLMMKTQEAIKLKMKEMQDWSFTPVISGFYTYNKKIMTTGFDMTPNHMAGLSLSIPIFTSGGRQHKISMAKIELEQAKNSRELIADQLLIQEKQLQYNLTSAIENYISQKENVDVAKRVYDNVNRKYSQGMVSSLDLTQANSNYLQAENNYIQSIMSLLQSKLALDKLLDNI